MMHACPGVGATPMIRMPDALEANMQKAYDLGILGTIVPTVDDVFEARDAARYARFPPTGRRSQGGSQFWTNTLRDTSTRGADNGGRAHRTQQRPRPGPDRLLPRQRLSRRHLPAAVRGLAARRPRGPCGRALRPRPALAGHEQLAAPARPADRLHRERGRAAAVSRLRAGRQGAGRQALRQRRLQTVPRLPRTARPGGHRRRDRGARGHEVHAARPFVGWSRGHALRHRVARAPAVADPPVEHDPDPRFLGLRGRPAGSHRAAPGARSDPADAAGPDRRHVRLGGRDRPRLLRRSGVPGAARDRGRRVRRHRKHRRQA